MLTTGSDADPLLPKLIDAINQASAIEICVSFVQPSGVNLLIDALNDALNNGAAVRILISDYLYITHPRALRILYQLSQRGAHVKLFRCTANHAFHLKSYIFIKESERLDAGTAFVGSSNLSASALTSGLEWNLRFDLDVGSQHSLNEFVHIRESFTKLFNNPNAVSLSRTLIENYQHDFDHVRQQQAPLIELLGTHEEPEPVPFTPNEAQLDALAELNKSRQNAYQRGLVVLATGMGKTWLAAFDAQQINAEKILFIAHREEILLQAEKTFRILFPKAHIGFYNGTEQDTESDFLFGSIQTIGKAEHLKQFAADYFDYIVIDEFHHAVSSSYQKLLNYFKPKFLLGLTATPERTDQSDILNLCDNNLVFERNLIDGIEQGILVPFHYYGIEDQYVDYQEIPWRNGRFDPRQLENVFATKKRAQHIYNHWLRHRQSRTLGFCMSKIHADFMTEYFVKRGVKAVAVYSNSRIRRNEALEKLASGEIDILFSVDLFNEGTDIPSVDTVLMARPTESKILFLQQLGRGLRHSAETGKKYLVVLDFIGNHQSFLTKPAALYGTHGIKDTVTKVKDKPALPEGCFINFDLGVVDAWKQIARVIKPDLAECYRELKLELGYRPTATQFYRAGYLNKILHAKLRKQFGGWLNFVAQQEDDESLKQVAERHSEFLNVSIEKAAMTKCFKAVLLQAFIALEGIARPVSEKQLAIKSREILNRYPEALSHDLSEREKQLSPESEKWLNYWRKNPIDAFCKPNKNMHQAPFSSEKKQFRLSFQVDENNKDSLEAAILELADFKMAQYVDRIR